MEPYERIILSLDGFKTIDEAARAMQGLGHEAHGSIIKMKALLDVYGRIAVTVMHDLGYRVFVDLKIHDTPDAAAERVAVWRDAGAEFSTVHASGHDEMMKKCVKAAGEKMKIVAVTVLTSFDHTASMHVSGRAQRIIVAEFAVRACLSGVHGSVASSQEE